ncbi:MAG: alanyl-tRNA editing protein [Candidatus Aenigmarchaeota archaeon]|nr:alanyl-tRNA editing protein [Candidatus Aenigmarchaeota archaeon]
MRPLYLEDSYLKEFDATIVRADGKLIVLDNTAFYPSGGGQPSDTGTVRRGDEEFRVVFAIKKDGNVSHEVDKEGLKEGDKVHCTIDWPRRYALMKMHTAAHVLSAIMHKETGALITGNQLGVAESRIDFSLENLDRDKITEYVRMANEAMARNIEVKHYFLPTEDAMKIEGVIKLAKALPPSVNELHIMEIGDIDKQADGGTHVGNTKEVGIIELLKLENKGKNNRRIYYTLKTE